MSVLAKIAGLKKATAENRRVPMTDKQVEQLTARLKAEDRMNVYPNKFDVKKPYRVQLRKGGEYTTYGSFTNVDVATAVGTLASAAAFGDKALCGDFDESIVEDHSEYNAWLADARNAAVIAAL